MINLDHDRIDLNNELHRVMCEVREEFNLLEDDAYCVAAKRHILNRWYRFDRFGVTTRSQLDPVTVTIKRGTPDGPPYIDPRWGDVTKTASVDVCLRGTPLAAGWKP